MNEPYQTLIGNNNTSKRGGEYFKIMRYVKNKWAVALTILLHFIVGALPVIMTILLGDMVNVFSNANFLEDFIPVILNMIYYVVGMFLASVISYAIRIWCNSTFP